MAKKQQQVRLTGGRGDASMCPPDGDEIHARAMRVRDDLVRRDLRSGGEAVERLFATLFNGNVRVSRRGKSNG